MGLNVSVSQTDLLDMKQLRATGTIKYLTTQCNEKLSFDEAKVHWQSVLNA